MKFKSHFQSSKRQRNGIFLLIIISIVLQLILFFVDFYDTPETIENQEDIEAFRKELDSLRQVEIENQKPKLYPFNPNYITDYKGYTLGMSNEEIDRLHNFRKQKKWVNSAKEFQNVTKVSDSLLSVISPYFKFPDWVTNPKTKTSETKTTNQPKKNSEKLDLNAANVTQLQKVYGVGQTLAERIVKYRTKQKGFISTVELLEIYGLSSEVIERIKEAFVIKTPRQIKTYNLNTATRDELVLIPYIDYEVAKSILEERTLREGFKSLDELLKVEDFPASKIEIIKLYLYL